MVNMKLVVSIYPKVYVLMLKRNSPRAKLEIRHCIGLHGHISPVHSLKQLTPITTEMRCNKSVNDGPGLNAMEQ